MGLAGMVAAVVTVCVGDAVVEAALDARLRLDGDGARVLAEAVRMVAVAAAAAGVADPACATAGVADAGLDVGQRPELDTAEVFEGRSLAARAEVVGVAEAGVGPG